MRSSNYIQDYVYGLSGVSQKRNFDENGNSVDPDFTYGDIKTSLTQRNINKDLNIHKDRVKKIHREAMNIRDTSIIKGQIWTRMDQDDPRMGRYNFPNKPDYPVGDKTNNLQYGRDITDVINSNVANNDIKALREFLTKNTIAPKYDKWIKYGTEETPYGFKLSIPEISNKINSIVPDHDTQNNVLDLASVTDNEYDYERTVTIDGSNSNFILKKGLEADKLNIYSYVTVESNKNPTNVSKKYYYIPADPFNFTDIVEETGNEGQYYRRYYERYHIVNSKVNSLRDDNSLRYSYDGSNFDLANLGDEFIFNIKTTDSSTSAPTDLNTILTLNSSNIEHGDYFREYSKKKWKVYGAAAPTNGRRLDISSGTVTSTEVTSTTDGFIFEKDLSGDSALNNIYLTKDDYFVYTDGGIDYYIVSAEPGRTVWMITKSATKENEDKATLQTEVRDVRNEAMNVRDSLGTQPSQLWLKMNRNDPRNNQYLYPELSPVHWNTGTNTKPEMGRDLENVLTSAEFDLLKTYVITASYTYDSYVALTISKPIYFDDYLKNSGTYYTIDYDKSRKEMGKNVSSVVSNFLTSTTVSSGNYILNSKIDTKTQNVLMDSLLEKQYGDLYVMNTASSDTKDDRIKPGDYYIESAEEDYVFGRVWVKTNLNKKLDFGRELYDSELTEILKSIVNPTSGTVLSTYTLDDTLDDDDFTTKFTTTDLANLGIKSLDYIYVCTDNNEDYYFKAMPNADGIYNGRKWDQVVVGAKPDDSFGRQLYHQNLSEKLNSTSDSNGKVTLTIDEYSNLNLDKLNLEPSNYILNHDNSASYRPKPIDIWLSVRSTENQHVYNKHRQESVSDNKYIAQDVRQNSDVPGQIWKKMTADEAKNLKFDYGAITPLAWETTSNGEIEPKKGRNLKEYLSGNTAVLNELREYINNQVFNLDIFNTHTNLRDFSDNGGFNHDDYVLLDTDGSTDLNKPHKYYTIDYDVSRNLNTTRDLSKDEFTISDTVSALKQDFNNNLLAYTPDSVIDFSTVIQSFNDIKDHIIQSSDNSPITFASNFTNIYYSLGNDYYYPNNDVGSEWTVTTTQPNKTLVIIRINGDVTDAVKQAFDDNLIAKTLNRVIDFNVFSESIDFSDPVILQSFNDIKDHIIRSVDSVPITFAGNEDNIYYSLGNYYYYPNNAEGSSWTVTTSQPNRVQVTISTDVSDAVKQAFDDNLTTKTSSRVTNFSSLSQSFTDIIPNTLDSSGSGPIDFNTDYNVVYYANENDYYYPNNAGGSEWTVTTTSPEGTKRLNIHTSKTSDQLIKFLTENNFENYSENYNYPYKKYYVDILNSTRDSKTNIITKYGDEYILLDHRDVPNREDDASNIATLVPNNIKYGDYYKDTNGNAWVAIRSHKKQKEYDDNTNYNEVRTLAKRKRSESTTVGDIWIKMKKTDPRFSKYNYENLNVSSSRDISTLSSSFKDFLEKNINLTDGSEQISFVLDSKVDFRTNRITEYGNEYVVTFNNDTYNSGTSPGPGYGQYHKKETNDYGDTWYSIGTKKPDKGRLIVSQEITDLIKAQIDIPSWQGINEILINVYATETAKSGNNSEDITVLQFLKDFNLTDDDYIKADIDSTPYYFRPKPHDLWVVTRSLDEQAKYDEKIRIKYRDVYQEAKAIRQSSKTIGQIWIQVDSLEDPRISKDKYPHRRALSTNTITGQLQTLLNNYTTKPYTADSGDSNISEFQREIYKSDGSSMVLDYVQNRFYVVDSDIDMATYQIKYDDSQDPLSVRSGLGKELVILDKNKIPNIDSGDHDSVIIDGKDMGQILRYGDYYSSGGKYYVVSRSYDEEHAKDLADQALKDLERANQNELDSNTLLNTYQFSDTDDRYGRLWQKVTTLDGYIISSNQKILKHTFAENSLESDGYTLKLTNTELDNLLSDFTMTEVLSTKYIKHPTKNQYFVTTNYGTTWEKHESLPEVGTEIFIKRDDPDGGTPTYFTSKDTVSPTSANNFGYTGDNVDDSTVTLSDDVEVLKLLLFNGLIDKYYIQNTSGNYYETDNVYNITAQTITWNKVDSIPLDKKILRTITSDVDSKLTSSSPTISVTEYEALLVANDYNSWAEHNSRKRHFVTQYIHKSGTNYYISNDGGYNWREIDNLNKVHNNTIYSYGIFHDTTKNILDSGRTLLTTDELDDLLNNAKYSASHKISTVEFSFADTTEYDTAEPYIVQEADNTIPINIASDFDVVYINIDDKYYYPNDDTALNWTVTLTEPTGTGRTKYIIQSSTPFKSRLINDGDTALGTLTGDLNSQYVSHRLLTNQHYLTDGSNHYIPQPLVNEDYKNYINMPGKGKLGKYWKLRYVVDAPTPTLTEITVNGSAAKQAIRDILEGNDNDINRYQYNKERLTLTKEERDVIAGGELVAITQNNYISHSVKPNYNYMSNDNGYNWFKVHNVSDSSVKLIQLEQDRDYNGNDIDLGNILYKIYTEDTGYGSYGSFDNKASNEFYINDNVFDNYEVEKYVRENGYIQHTVSNVIYTFVPGEYINENYNYFSADNEYPAKNTLGRIWNILGITPNGNGGLYTDADTTKFDKLKELLYSKNILDIDLNSNDFIINLSTTTNIYYQATDNKFYYPADATGTSWVRTTTRPEDKLEFRLDFTPPDNSANDTFNNALINSATTTITIQATEYTSIKIDLDSTRNVYYKVVDTSDTYYYIPTDENKRRWYAQKDVPINSLRIVQNGGVTSDSLSSQLIERTNTNMNMKGTNPTVTLSYEEYALYVKPSIIAIDKYIQIGNKFYVPGRLINDYQDNFYLPVP